MSLSELNRRLRRWLWTAPRRAGAAELRDASHRLANETAALTALVAAINRSDEPRRHEPAHR